MPYHSSANTILEIAMRPTGTVASFFLRDSGRSLTKAMQVWVPNIYFGQRPPRSSGAASSIRAGKSTLKRRPSLKYCRHDLGFGVRITWRPFRSINTSSVSKRNILGRRTAWLRPVAKTFAVARFIYNTPDPTIDIYDVILKNIPMIFSDATSKARRIAFTTRGGRT